MELERPAPRWSTCFARIECLKSGPTAFLEQERSPGPHVTCSGYPIKSLGDSAPRNAGYGAGRLTPVSFKPTTPRARTASSRKYASVRSSPVVRSVSGFHPSRRWALPMSGQRRAGSSTGNGPRLISAIGARETAPGGRTRREVASRRPAAGSTPRLLSPQRRA
jgi:hypothetical protein